MIYLLVLLFRLDEWAKVLSNIPCLGGPLGAPLAWEQHCSLWTFFCYNFRVVQAIDKCLCRSAARDGPFFTAKNDIVGNVISKRRSTWKFHSNNRAKEKEKERERERERERDFWWDTLSIRLKVETLSLCLVLSYESRDLVLVPFPYIWEQRPCLYLWERRPCLLAFSLHLRAETLSPPLKADTMSLSLSLPLGAETISLSSSLSLPLRAETLA